MFEDGLAVRMGSLRSELLVRGESVSTNITLRVDLQKRLIVLPHNFDIVDSDGMQNIVVLKRPH